MDGLSNSVSGSSSLGLGHCKSIHPGDPEWQKQPGAKSLHSENRGPYQIKVEHFTFSLSSGLSKISHWLSKTCYSLAHEYYSMNSD